MGFFEEVVVVWGFLFVWVCCFCLQKAIWMEKCCSIELELSCEKEDCVNAERTAACTNFYYREKLSHIVDFQLHFSWPCRQKTVTFKNIYHTDCWFFSCRDNLPEEATI